MDKIVIVVKDGREMEANANPDGLKELARFGWKVKPEVDEAAKKLADEAAAKKLADEAEQFKTLSEQCKAKNIKVVAADTIETLTQKLSA